MLVRDSKVENQFGCQYDAFFSKKSVKLTTGDCTSMQVSGDSSSNLVSFVDCR